MEVLKRIASSFHLHHNDIAKTAYLDVVIGLEANGVVSPLLQSKPVNPNPVKGTDIHASPSVLAGSMLVWQDFLSPDFLDGYYKTSSFLSVTWLREPEQHHKGKDHFFPLNHLEQTTINRFFSNMGREERPG
jgi:hypothetical protein